MATWLPNGLVGIVSFRAGWAQGVEKYFTAPGHGGWWCAAQAPDALTLLLFLATFDFFLEGFLVALSAAFFAARLRRCISSLEYMVPRHFFAPQLQMASSSPPS
jgi:hypothetical protein